MKVVLTALALGILAAPALGDELRDLEKRLELLTAREAVLKKEKEVEGLREDIAELRSKSANFRKQEAERLRDARAVERLDAVPTIVINMGTIASARYPDKFCNATPFLQYKCHALKDCPEFTVDGDICPLPGGETEPMVLTVNYSCGTSQRDLTFPVGAKAWISCK
ncbi:hypothetical protein [Pacificoceanicola onchidii]|uniref:hypothetical protein n=1 Tax=Pacificoceanicola onchidii TaxID=2562685 RepID=UPI0010A3241A|nr:hypothetical protein [Pacificoceanicola onchidii]